MALIQFVTEASTLEVVNVQVYIVGVYIIIIIIIYLFTSYEP